MMRELLPFKVSDSGDKPAAKADEVEMLRQMVP
jgi:hypothetical protein